LKGKKSIKKDLIFSKVNKKNKDYNLNKNKMRGHISIFLWPMHIPRPCKRERKKKTWSPPNHRESQYMHHFIGSITISFPIC
jgi:hypothetical protein